MTRVIRGDSESWRTLACKDDSDQGKCLPQLEGHTTLKVHMRWVLVSLAGCSPAPGLMPGAPCDSGGSGNTGDEAVGKVGRAQTCSPQLVLH